MNKVWVVAIAAGLAIAVPAVNAHADVRLFFTRLIVNDCAEIGNCDWKLSCALGNQQETEFLSSAEADTNESIPINRVLTQRDFPVTVTCTAQEYDGGIGALWEPIGTSSVIVTTTGNHLIRLNQNSSEGDVTVHFTVDNIGSTSQPLTVSAPITSGVGKCLDVHAPDQNLNGAKVQVWDCNGTVQQRWSFQGAAIVSGAGKCLDVHAPDQHLNGAKVQVWDCNGTLQQRWTLQGNVLRSGAGKCLDVHAPDQHLNGAKVQVWDCNGTVQQRWGRR